MKLTIALLMVFLVFPCIAVDFDKEHFDEFKGALLCGQENAVDLTKYTRMVVKPNVYAIAYYEEPVEYKSEVSKSELKGVTYEGVMTVQVTVVSQRVKIDSKCKGLSFDECVEQGGSFDKIMEENSSNIELVLNYHYKEEQWEFVNLLGDTYQRSQYNPFIRSE